MRQLEKHNSPLMKFINFFVRIINPKFMEMFTTIGSTIYVPENNVLPRIILKHEIVHVEQWRKWGILYYISYLLLPIPFGLAWFRWKWEREAYMVNLAYCSDIEWCIDILWDNYGWCWPKPWMRAWFEKELRK